MAALRRPLSIHTRLALGYTIFFALVLVLLIVGVFLTVRHTLLGEIGQQLMTSGDLIQQDFDASNDELTGYFNDANFLLRTLPPHVEGLESPTLYVQAVTPTGVVAVTSASLAKQHLPLDDNARKGALAGRSQTTVALLGEARILLFVRPLLADNNIVGILEVAQPLREVDRTLRLLMLSLIVIGTIVLIAAVRTGMWLTRRALQPVSEIAQTARQIVHAEHLSQRVRDAQTDDEIGELTTTINEMLARLDQLFTTQHRFVADVSHELRTPLTAMRGNLEILRRGAAYDRQELDESLADMEREVNRLTRLTSDLLILAQAETGTHLRCIPLALDDLVLEVVRELRPLNGEVALMPAIAEQVEIVGDRDRLKQTLINLIMNALQHTPPGGSVRIALECDEHSAFIRVSDTGTGIAAEDLPHVFDRFYRADKARARSIGGAGLGLAIVRWVVEAHGGNVSVDSELGRGSTFMLTLPRASKNSTQNTPLQQAMIA